MRYQTPSWKYTRWQVNLSHPVDVLDGLANINKQTRYEFRSLLLRVLSVTELRAQVNNWPAFVYTFFGPGTENLRSQNVLVMFPDELSDKGSTWNLSPILFARTTTSGLHLKSQDGISRAIRSHGHWYTLCPSLSGIPRGLLAFSGPKKSTRSK
jgi:hypothetical protein